MVEQLPTGARTAVLAALEIVPFAMLVADQSGAVRAANQGWERLTGQSADAAAGQGWLSKVEASARGFLRSEVLTKRSEDPVCVDRPLDTPDGQHWTRWWITRHEVDGTALTAIAVCDVQDEYSRQADLYRSATHDALTGLATRPHFLESVDAALGRNRRRALRVGMVYVDLDGLHTVDDTGGRDLHDRVIAAIAARVRHAVRDCDAVGRVGPDEFAVLCEGLLEPDDLGVVARRIYGALDSTIEAGGRRWSVTSLVGTSLDEGTADTAVGLVHRAASSAHAAREMSPPGAGAEPEGPERERWGRFFEAPGPQEPTEPPVEAGDDPVNREHSPRERVLLDAIALRESLSSIRSLLDRLLSTQDMIDIRDRAGAMSTPAGFATATSRLGGDL